MKKNNYFKGFIINVVIGIILGILSEFALIYNIEKLINITQSEIVWLLLTIIISLFSINYISTLINTSTNLLCMIFSYYIVRLIKSGYTNIYHIEWYGLMAICLSLYVGTAIFLIKEKIRNKRINNYIPKTNIVIMTISLPIAEVIYSSFIKNINIQPIVLDELCMIISAIIGTIIGTKINIKKIGANKMEFKKEENRIYVEDDNNILAEIEFEKLENNNFNIYHTFVDETLRGQGIASKLVELAVEEIKSRGGNVQATCSYAKKWLEKNKYGK